MCQNMPDLTGKAGHGVVLSSTPAGELLKDSVPERKQVCVHEGWRWGWGRGEGMGI